MVESDEQQPERDSGGGAAMAALHQCELIQNMIDISISSLQGLRTKCAASNDLTQQEIRTLEVMSFSDASVRVRASSRDREAAPSNCGVMKLPTPRPPRVEPSGGCGRRAPGAGRRAPAPPRLPAGSTHRGGGGSQIKSGLASHGALHCLPAVSPERPRYQ